MRFLIKFKRPFQPDSILVIQNKQLRANATTLIDSMVIIDSLLEVYPDDEVIIDNKLNFIRTIG